MKDLPFDWGEALRHLKRRDPALKKVIEATRKVELTLAAEQTPFEALFESIVYQQLSGKAAGTILGRAVALFAPKRFPDPEDVIAIEDAKLRGAGLSTAKTAAVKDLARKTLDGVVPELEVLHGLSDDEIVERLTEVRGIGRWTVEMMLIFRLGRPDVLPVADYGVRKGFAKTYRMRALPTPAQMEKRAEAWRPFRSVGSWYMWRALETPGADATGRSAKREKSRTKPAKKKSRARSK